MLEIKDMEITLLYLQSVRMPRSCRGRIQMHFRLRGLNLADRKAIIDNIDIQFIIKRIPAEH